MNSSFPLLLNNPRVEILYLTYNRLYYTKITLPALLDSSNAPYSIWIIDNGSTDGTVEYLKSINHKRIKKIIYNKKNEGLVRPTKDFWKQSSAELIGKIDNDIMVPKKWVDKLIDAHLQIPELGVCGYCHFREEDYNNDIVEQNVEDINGIYIRRQPWIGGNYIMKRSTVFQYRGYRQSRKLFNDRTFYGFTKYQKKLSDKGLIHGYLCDEKKNLLLWGHIDDPRNEHFQLNSNYSNRLVNNNIIDWYKQDAKQLLEDWEIDE